MPATLHQQKVLVIGLNPSGKSAASLLVSLGAQVTATPSGLRDDSQIAKSLEKNGVTVRQNLPAGQLSEFAFAVLSASTSRTAPIVRAALANNLSVISDLELGSQHACCLSLAVTGSNGKTTTSELIESILKNADRKTIRAGGSGETICSAVSRSRELDFLTLDISPFELESIEHFRPAVAVLLNLKPDFLDQYSGVADYARVNGRLFQNQQAFDWAVVQSEALAQLRLLDVPIPSKVITFSAANRRADLYVDRGLLISRMDDWTGPLLDMDHCILRGPHHSENIMAALAVGHILHIPLEIMVEAVKKYQPGPHRFELVAEVNGVQFINDSKARNVEATRRAIESVRPGRGGEPNVFLIAGGKDKGLEYHDLGPLLAQRAKNVFLLGQTREKLRAAWGLFTACSLVDSIEEAVVKAADSAAPGDVVLLSPACSSYDMFEDYHQRGEMFRDAVLKLSTTTSSVHPDNATISSGKTIESMIP